MESFDQLFDMIKEQCREQLSDIAFTLWIKDIIPLKFEDSTAYLQVKSVFKKNVLEEKYIPMLKKAFENSMGFDVSIVLEADAATPEIPVSTPVDAEDNEENTFQTFVVGNSNQFAHAASQAVAENPGKAWNPLFIHGPSGLGKTHLLSAIGSEILKKNPLTNIVVVTGENFTNELIDAIKTSSTKNFHDKYRSADVLLVDDVQFIAGKESTQEEFFHTFDALHQDGKQIVLTSDRPPKEIKTLEERLLTRFEWGLLADIQPPDFETRTAIIRRKATAMDFKVPTEVAEYIANRLKNNIRQLEGTVKKLKAYYQLENSPPSIIVVQNTIRDILNDDQPVPVTIDRIISEVARTYNVSASDIRSNKRSAAISNARQIAMFVVREITQLSMAAIGVEFGGRDHSTVVYATQQVEKNLSRDSHYRETVEDIIKNIRNS